MAKCISIIEKFLKDTLPEMIKLLSWKTQLILMNPNTKRFGTTSTKNTWKYGTEVILTESISETSVQKENKKYQYSKCFWYLKI